MGLFLPINNQEIFKTENGINYLPISNLNREHLSILDKLHGALEKWENWMNFMKSDSISLEEILNHIEINLKPNFNDFSENRSYLKLKNKLLQYNSIYSENLNGIEILKIIDQAVELGLKYVKILGAGEPFENPDFLTFLIELC